MLQIKKLQMLGFKSFCDRTEMHFSGKGLVAIVGPNGCGKSNIADAVSWVLGEQSAKSLRGGRMEDVIFAGTRDRPATGFAEVSLTLVDPAELALEAAGPEPAAAEPVAEMADDGWSDDAAAPAAPVTGGSGVVLTIRQRRRFTPHNRRGEIVVTRRLYRSGESEYLMNHRPCRLRDIQDIFMGTGLGPESYAIIEQGRIGQILSSRPHDRRAVIEEAAGVSKYKAKRRLAEARLESARLNLSRLNDIFEEVTRQVGSLKRQAAKAQRYRNLKAQFDGRQRELICLRAEAQEAALGEARGRHESARGEVQAAAQAIQGQEAARSEAARRCAQQEDELRALGEACARLERELGEGRQQLAFYAQQETELGQRLESNAAQRERLAEQGQRLEAEHAGAAEELRVSDVALAEARAQVAARQAEHQQGLSAVRAIETALEAARAEVLQLMRASAAQESRIAQGEAQLAGLDRTLAKLAAQMEAAEAELAHAGARRGQLALAFEDLEAEGEALARRAAELAPQADALREREETERLAAEADRAQLAGHAARRRSLEEIVAHHGYSSEAVKQLFAASKSRGPIAAGVPLEEPIPATAAARFKPMGVLGEFVEVDTPYDRVVEQFLHDELDYVVVHTWDEAGAGVDLLRAQAQGRATFLVHLDHELAEPPVVAEERRRLEAEEGLQPLLREVKALNGFRGGLGRVIPKLGNAWLLDDSERARRLALECPHSWFLTRQGECFHQCTVSGGSGNGAGPLSLKRELRELIRDEAALRHRLEQREQALKALESDRTAVRVEMEELAARRHDLEKRLLTSGQAVRQVEGELRRVEAQLAHDRLESERGRGERRQLDEALTQTRLDVARGRDALAVAQSGQDEAAAQVAAARQAAEAAGQALAEARALLARREERVQAATAACERILRLTAELTQRSQQMEREAAGMQQRRQEIAAATAAGAARVEELQAGAAAAQARQAEAQAALGAARAAAEQLELGLGAARADLEGKRALAGELEVALARLEGDAEHLREVCRNECGMELEELRRLAAENAAAAPAVEDEDAVAVAAGDRLAALEAAVRELRHKIENLGPVNMMALEEFEEAQQRHAFMETQRKDLMDSIADTQKAIVEMDTVSREKFAEAFEKINANFQETFKVLFGGGQGFLRLSEVEGDGEAGVDLVAQPPGKKLQNALLLSGGEKAMTAMALLLAIFQYQPSPFCLLDEVDAPMDEANVIRFSDMIRRMGSETQFLVITHNKRTMEACPTLYGVTMPQPGVSRLVSVQVEEARAVVA